jgi:ATP-dependent protease ClpP protease subunit
MDKTLFSNGKIMLFGDVGDTWSGDCFTPGDVARALADNGDGDATVHLNSGGGIATDGMAIFSLFKAHPGKVNIVIDGVAASAASLIAMAGDTRTMRNGAMMMIHDPATITVGNVAAHEKNIATLDKLAANYAGVYGRASGKTPEAARTIMKAETWLTADEAVAQGFATAIAEEKAATASAFDYRIYMRAPSGLPMRAARTSAPHGVAAVIKTITEIEDRAVTAAAAIVAAAARMRMRQRQL